MAHAASLACSPTISRFAAGTARVRFLEESEQSSPVSQMDDPGLHQARSSTTLRWQSGRAPDSTSPSPKYLSRRVGDVQCQTPTTIVIGV